MAPDEHIRQANRSRLELYKQGMPYREELKKSTAGAVMVQQPLVPVAGPSEAKIDDIVVTIDRCVLQDGLAVTNLPRGIQLRVIALNADWVGCSVLVDGKEQRGWVKKWLVSKVP